jgi:hypothetical protein
MTNETQQENTFQQVKKKKSLMDKIGYAGKVIGLAGALATAYYIGLYSMHQSYYHRIAKVYPVIEEERDLRQETWHYQETLKVLDKSKLNLPTGYDNFVIVSESEQKLREGYLQVRAQEKFRLEEEIAKLKSQEETLIKTPDFEIADKIIDHKDYQTPQVFSIITFSLGAALWGINKLRKLDGPGSFKL